MLAQLIEHRVQEPPPLCGLACLRIYLGEECIKFLVVWPLDTFCPNSFFVDMVLTVVIAIFIQQLSILAAVPAAVVRSFTDLIFATLRCGYYHLCLTDVEIEAPRGVLRSYSQGMRELVWEWRPL